ncbi:hypothetical protein LSH36_104g03069 [Paralvinella palmiformis]|uniref:Telomerase protein component 1 n=1 Tax=Paralvinella palmiformis TaxID=53620 RepID=A0AAD9NBH8_9ANNE|nr:hypothetical protein LSH36_104g03069 [Paralvinella palmiformis]
MSSPASVLSEMGSSSSVSSGSSRQRSGVISHDSDRVCDKPPGQYPEESMQQPKTDEANQPKVLDAKEVWIEVFNHLEMKLPEEEDYIKKRFRTEWHNIRIFVSSTFKDFKYEREVLVKQVFQDLRLWCQQRRLRLIDVDLRWGVPRDTNSEETLVICMEEIKKCRQENIMPYFINLTSARRGWVPNPDQIQPEVVKDYGLVYGLSVTEMEIVRGAFEKRNPNAIFLMRDDSFLDEMKKKKVLVSPDFIHSKLEERRKELDGLKELKLWIKKWFDVNQVETYKCHYKGGDKFPLFDFEPEDIFSKTVLDFFKKRISIQYPDDEYLPENDFLKTRIAHECFMEIKGQRVQGRDDILDKIMEYLDTNDACSPMLIVGEAGSGKSSLMALAVKKMKEKLEKTKENCHLFCHFVGALPSSTELTHMLCRLLVELEIVTETTLPSDHQTACPLVYGVLKNPETRPVIIMVDAINQIDQSMESEMVRWLPPKLAPRVRCIVSAISNSVQHQHLVQMEPKPVELHVKPLAKKDCEDIIRETLLEYNKRLSDEEMSTFLKKKAVTNPLWLSVACEELRVSGEFRKKVSKHKYEYLIPKKIKGDVLIRLRDESEKEIGQLIVSTLCLLEVSRSGLLEDELLSLLQKETFEDEKEKDDTSQEESLYERLPAQKWSIVERALRSFLRPFGTLGEGRIDFYHRSISKVVRKRFLGDRTEKQRTGKPNGKVMDYHKKLADYFWNSAIIYRKVEELPYHLTKLGDSQSLQRFLSEWETLEEMFDPELSTTLFRYWRESGDTTLEIMKTSYENHVEGLKNDVNTENPIFGQKLAKLAALILQSGDFSKALTLAKQSIVLENELKKDLGHVGRLINSYNIAAKACLQLARQFEIVCEDQLPHLYSCADYCRKAIDLFNDQSIDSVQRDTKVKLANQKYVLAYSLIMIDEIKGTYAPLHNGKLPKEESIEVIKEARQIFEELTDIGSVANAMRTEAMVYWRKAEVGEQLKLFEEARSLCRRTYGRYHWLSAAIEHNMGVAKEYHGKLKQAYSHYKESYLINFVVCGPTHKETMKEMGAMRSQDYKIYHKEKKLIKEAENQM